MICLKNGSAVKPDVLAIRDFAVHFPFVISHFSLSERK